MTAQKVALYWTCKTPEGWKRYPAAIGRNGKIRPRYAQVGKAQKLYPVGHYDLRHTEDRKTVWTNVGEDSAEAQAQQDLTARRLAVERGAAEAGIQVIVPKGRIDLSKKAKEYIERQIARGKNESAITFKGAIKEFLPSAKAEYADQLSEQAILRWYAALRKKGNSNRTIHNKHISVFGFLKWCGIDTKPLAAKAPDYTEKEVEIYERDELKQFFEALTEPYHRLVFEILLKMGLRMQEAMFLEWHNISFGRGVMTVTEKDDQGFDVKDKDERTVPISADLLERLKEWKQTHGTRRLVLGTRNDTPNWKWLDMLKRLARRARLNCGHCQGCREKNECGRWYLHKFRATYTTNLLRSGIDARTVMKYTGHEDLATVMRYLVPAEGEETQKKITSIAWGF